MPHKATDKCPECGGELKHGTFQIEGHKRIAHIEYSFCPACGWENKLRIKHLRRKE